MLDPKVRTFLTICKHMNFTKAADELCMTQPAVSTQMKQLELFYKAPLFLYKNKVLTLTNAGKTVLATMKSLENQEGFLQAQLDFISSKKRNIKFGATKTISEFLIADIIKDYLVKFPNSSIHMSTANTLNLLSMLDNGEIDFAFIEGNFSKKNYKSYPFKNSNFIPVCGSQSCLKDKEVSLTDLFNERLIIREQGSGTRDIFENVLKIRNHDISEFNSLVEISSMSAIRNLVLSSVGISFLYEDVVKEELEKGTLFKINLFNWNVKHKMQVVWRRENQYTETIEDFLAILES